MSPDFRSETARTEKRSRRNVLGDLSFDGRSDQAGLGLGEHSFRQSRIETARFPGPSETATISALIAATTAAARPPERVFEARKARFSKVRT